MFSWLKLRADSSLKGGVRSLEGKSSLVTEAGRRLDSIDCLRGLVIALMALDHTRVFFGTGGLNPSDVGEPALFLTRWITHFCAPTFILLAGVAAYLYGARGGSKPELSQYLLTRGFFLILIEFTVVRIAWTFNLSFDPLIAGVIWVIGASMMCLAALVFLPRAAIAVVAVIMVAGHNLLDSIQAETVSSANMIWHLLHQPGLVRFGDGTKLYVAYPLIPWIGVMAAGYSLGPVMKLDANARRRWLLTLGGAITTGFLLLRAVNFYGDPVAWTIQETWFATILSFINSEKYPPSLLFLMMTIGPALILLAALEHARGKVARWLTTFGRVPFFFYVAHLYLIHGLAVAFALVALPNPSVTTRPEISLGLVGVYLAWLAVLVLLYPLCSWFADIKRGRREWWWSYA